MAKATAVARLVGMIATFFSFAFGALAQLGERLICIQEVIGSIPIGSTNPPRHEMWREDGSVAQVVRAHA